jgi:hypothetical protein
MPDPKLARIEKLLGVAHRAVWTAAQVAESTGSEGLFSDLNDLAYEVTRISSELLRSHDSARYRLPRPPVSQTGADQRCLPFPQSPT